MTAAPRPTILAGMIPPGPDTLDVLIRLAPLASAVAAALVVGIMAFGVYEMRRSNNQRAKDASAAQAAAADDRKVTQGMLAALQELIRRTSPPSSQAGPRPGPAE